MGLDHPNRSSCQLCLHYEWAASTMEDALDKGRCKGHEAEVTKAAKELSKLAKQIGEIDEKASSIVNLLGWKVGWDFYKNRRINKT